MKPKQHAWITGLAASLLLHSLVAGGAWHAVSPMAKAPPLVIDLTLGGGPESGGPGDAPPSPKSFPGSAAPARAEPPGSALPVEHTLPVAQAPVPGTLPAPPVTAPAPAAPAPAPSPAPEARPVPNPSPAGVPVRDAPGPWGGAESAASARATAGPPGGTAAAAPTRTGSEFPQGGLSGATSSRATPGTGMGTGAGTGQAGDPRLAGRAGYLERDFAYIRDAIQQGVSYPPVARKMGWEGKVVVAFLVRMDGSVRDVRIVQGSGHAALDRGAVDAVRKAAPFPKPPAEAEIITPVVYRLE